MIHTKVACLLLLVLLCVRPAAGQSNSSPELQRKIDQYVSVTLQADLSHLSASQRELIGVLIEAGKLMDECFWYEAYGEKASLLKDASAEERQYIFMNYGPWDRLDANAPFVPGVGAKPKGANFYPIDMTREEFESAKLSGKDGLYTFVRVTMRGI